MLGKVKELISNAFTYKNMQTKKSTLVFESAIAFIRLQSIRNKEEVAVSFNSTWNQSINGKEDGGKRIRDRGGSIKI